MGHTHDLPTVHRVNRSDFFLRDQTFRSLRDERTKRSAGVTAKNRAKLNQLISFRTPNRLWFDYSHGARNDQITLYSVHYNGL